MSQRIPLLFVTAIALLQCVLWPSQENLLVVAGCWLGACGAIAYFAPERLWRQYPLSMLSLAGYAIYYFALPPFATLLELMPASSSLNQTDALSIHSLIGFVSLVVAHVLYRVIRQASQFREVVSTTFLKQLGVFKYPSTLQAILIGGIGLVTGIARVLIEGAGTTDAEQGLAAKVLHGVSIFMFFPYVLALPTVFGAPSESKVRSLVPLLAYSVPLTILALVRNSRTVMLVGVASLVIAAAWGYVSGVWRPKWIRPTTAFAGLLLAAVLIGPTSDMATAMVLARSDRRDVSPVELIQLTLAAYQDKDAIRDYRVQYRLRSDGSALDEWYVDNVFFSRLCNLRFLDISLGLADTMETSQRDEIRKFETQRVISIFPRPIIELFGIDANKDEVFSMSSGDYMLFASTGNRKAVGGFRTGSMLGNGFVVFGWMYSLAIVVLAVPTFALLDSLSSRASDNRVFLSPLCATMLFTIVFHWTSAATGCESISEPATFLFRGWLQTIVLYAIVFHLTRVFSFVNRSSLR